MIPSWGLLVTDSWDDETAATGALLGDEELPGSFDEQSLEIDLAGVLLDSQEIARRELAATKIVTVPPLAATPGTSSAGDVVVFEPTAIGLTATLTALG
jgi:hypothetical protein